MSQVGWYCQKMTFERRSLDILDPARCGASFAPLDARYGIWRFTNDYRFTGIQKAHFATIE